MKKALLLLSFVLGLFSMALAQEVTVSGVVADASGEPLPGVTVQVKGTTVGTVTGLDGDYSLVAPAEGILVFRMVGYKVVEVKVANQSKINATLSEDAEQLEEVVVTALGFEASRDKMGASASKIEAKGIVESGETGVLNGMAGKASGVQITRSSGDPGAGSYIQIRGQSTITGNLQPLIIIDGIPVSNSSRGEDVDGVSQQSRLNDINPNDIASMQVLKGASAAALWGSRAANGVIIITTKKGSNSGGSMNVSFRSTVSFDKVNRSHELQDTYGQGTRGAYSPTQALSWGDKIADRSGAADVLDMTGGYFVSETGNKYYPILERNSQETYNQSNWDAVFQTGHFMENNLSISGGDVSGTYFLSLSDLRQEGTMRAGSDYNRSTIRFNADRKFGDSFKVTNNFSYAKVTSDRVQKGSNLAGLFLGLLRTPADFDIRDYKGDYYASEGAVPMEGYHRSYRRYLGSNNPIYNNPLWTINEQQNPSEVNRFIGSSEMMYMPAEWVDVIVRGGIDYSNDKRSTYFPVYSGNNTTGAYSEFNLTEAQYNFDVISRVSKNINEDIQTTTVFGFNYNQNDYNSIGGSMNTFIIDDAPANFDNAIAQNKTPSNFRSTVKTARAYATTNISFYEKLFWNASLAGESSSVFGEDAQSTFFYPSTDLAYQLVKGGDLLSFAKLRASWGQVGVQPNPYSTRTYYESAAFTESWGPSLDASGYGGAYMLSATQGDAAIKPEIKTEYEVGGDFRFFQDRLSVGATYFYNQTKDAILPVAVAPSTGFEFQYTNAGSLENQGIELEAGFQAISTGDFSLSFDANWTRLRNKVLSLNGTESLFLAGFTGTSSRAVEGQPLGVLWGSRFARDADGELILNENGFPTKDVTEGVVGNPNADWRGGLGTTLKYKGVRLYVLFEHSQGGDMWGGTTAVLDHFGRSARTATESVVPEGGLYTANGTFLEAGSTFRGTIHDFGAGNVALDQSYYSDGLGSGFNGVSEVAIEDATWTRLREVTLSYSMKNEWLKDNLHVGNVNFSATGRNLLLWTDFMGIDPETNLTGASNGRGLDYFNNPNTRSLVFSVQVDF
ncbi:SusC/RagA family TonB-linked outer membrane protein [Algivirga pacifica]|uniref:SusC/RagA family TonB-linked outer membrane protein n=1 Tax=Algivirga pacifica TaxID=1162670 RepID=A0ABP9DK60_9BACT